MIGCYEDLQAFNWSKAQTYAGKITLLITLASSILGFFLGKNVGVCVYGLFLSLLIAVLEFPGLYMCIPNCKMVTSKIEDSPIKQNGFLNFIIWTIFSIITFLPPSSINILSGICCLLTGIINLLGWVFRLQEEKEMKANTKYNAVPGERIPITGGAPRPSGSGNGLPSWAGGSAV